MKHRWAALVAIAGATTAACALIVDLPEYRARAAADLADAGADADAGPRPTDGSTDAPGLPDAPAGPCDPLAPFGAPEVVASLSSENDETGVFFSADERSVWLSRKVGAAPSEVLVGNRPSPAAPFTSLMPLTTDALTAAVTADSALLLVTRETYRIGLRALTDAGVGGVSEPPELNVSPLAVDPYPVAGRVYFASGTTALDLVIYEVSQAGASFGAPTVVTLGRVGLVAPVVSDDQLVLYVAAGNGAFEYDIFRAVRSATFEAFGPLVRVDELSTSSSDWPRFLSRDQCRLYMTRGNGAGRGVDVMVARR